MGSRSEKPVVGRITFSDGESKRMVRDFAQKKLDEIRKADLSEKRVRTSDGETSPNRLEIVVPGEPVVQPRGKPVKRGKFTQMVSAYSDHKVWSWRERIVYEARKAFMGNPFTGSWRQGPLILSVLFVTPFTGTARKRGDNPRRWHDARKDLDNFLKPLKDALVEAGMMGDDGQIVMYGHMAKIRAAHGEQPHTRIRIEAAPPVESIKEVWA